jgi:hypothetical protein
LICEPQTEVERVAMQNAAAIARLLLTTYTAAVGSRKGRRRRFRTVASR